MVIVDVALEPYGVPERLDLTHQPHIHTGRQHVVYRLFGYAADPITHAYAYVFRRGMGMIGQPGQRGTTHSCGPQAKSAKPCRDLSLFVHRRAGHHR